MNMAVCSTFLSSLGIGFPNAALEWQGEGGLGRSPAAVRRPETPRFDGCRSTPAHPQAPLTRMAF
jgi:hypothetical protein